jgi:hypothetical protein
VQCIVTLEGEDTDRRRAHRTTTRAGP